MAIGKLLKFIDNTDIAEFRMNSKTLQQMEESGDPAALDAVSKLRSKFTATDIGDGELFWERNIDDEVMRQVRGEKEAASAAESNLMDGEQHIYQGQVPDGTSPVAKSFDISSQVSGITLPSRLKENWQVLNGLPERLNLNLTPKHWNTMPTLYWNQGKVNKGLKQIFSNPKHAFEELSKDLVETPSLHKHQEDAFGKHAKQIFDDLTMKLSRVEREQFNNLLREGNDSEDVFKPVAGGVLDSKGNFFEVNEKVQEAYYGTRVLLDHMHWVTNGAAVRQARNKDFKVFSVTDSGGETVEALTRKVRADLDNPYPDLQGNTSWLTKDKLNDGFELHELKRPDGTIRKVILSPDDVLKYTKEIPDNFQIIPFRKGYVPVMYTDQFHVHELRKMKDGTFETRRVATADTRVKANSAVNKLRESKELDDDTLSIEYLWARKNDGSIDVDFSDSLQGITESLSVSERDALKQALKKMGMTDAEAAVFEETGRFFSHKQNSFLKKRGANRLKAYTLDETAPTLPADEAIYKYMQGTSSYQAHAEYTSLLEKEYLKEFGGLLDDPANFQSRIRWGHAAPNGRTSLEAYLVRSQINRANGLPTYMDRVVQKAIDSTVDTFFDSKVGKEFSNIIDKMADTWGVKHILFNPSLTKATAQTKSFASAAKLGMWNWSQMGIQSTAMLNTIGSYPPNVVAGAFADMTEAIAPEVLKFGRTARGRKLYEAIDQSGFIAGFDYVELQKFAAKGNPTIMGSRRMKKILDTHMIPYHAGEGGVRALAWYAERRKLINEIRAGKSKYSMDDVDSFEFLQDVSRGAMVPALNMTRMNQPLIARGIIGVPMQFTQFVIQQSEFMLRSSNFNSKWAQAATLGAWAGVFGIQGIPFIFDVFVFTEAVVQKGAEILDDTGIIRVNAPEFSGFLRRSGQELIDTLSKPMAKELEKKFDWDYNSTRAFAQRLAQSGVGSAISQGEFNIASRASLARVFTEYYGNTTLDDMIGGPGYQTAKMLLTNNIGNAAELLQMWRNNEEFSNDKVMRLLASGTQGVPGLTNPAQAIEAAKTGKWKSADGRLILNEPTFTQEVLIGIGLQPGKRGERFERLEFSQKYKMAVGRHVRRRAAKIAKLLSQGHEETAQELFDATVADLANTDPRVLRKFNPILTRALLGRHLDEEGKELFYGMTDALIMQSEGDNVLLFGERYESE